MNVSKLLAKTGGFWVQMKRKYALDRGRQFASARWLCFLFREIAGRVPKIVFFSVQVKELVDG